MTLWDHIGPKQREEMAEMLRPAGQERPVITDFFLSLKQKGEIRELFTLRRLDSLLPFVKKIDKAGDGTLRKMQVAIVSTSKVQSIRICDMEGKRSFSLPSEVLEQVASDLGLFDGTGPVGLPPLS